MARSAALIKFDNEQSAIVLDDAFIMMYQKKKMLTYFKVIDIFII